MKNRKSILISLALVLILSFAIPAAAQLKGMESITAEELRFHLSFLAADEFQGRNTPSDELKIASRYIALMAEKYGLKPLMPDGSFFQEIPLEITTVSEAKTHIRLFTDMSEQTFFFPKAFGMRGRTVNPGNTSGEVVFLGYGLSAPNLSWDDYGEVDLKGKIGKEGEMEEIFRTESNTIHEESLSALVHLGFTKSAVDKVIRQILAEKKDLTVEEVVKVALKRI